MSDSVAREDRCHVKRCTTASALVYAAFPKIQPRLCDRHAAMVIEAPIEEKFTLLVALLEGTYVRKRKSKEV